MEFSNCRSISACCRKIYYWKLCRLSSRCKTLRVLSSSTTLDMRHAVKLGRWCCCCSWRKGWCRQKMRHLDSAKALHQGGGAVRDAKLPPALDLRYRLGLGNLRRSVSGQTLFADLFEKVTRFPSLVMDREQTGNFLGFLIRQSAPWSIASRLWHTITNRIGSWRDETRSHSPDIRSRRGRYAVENTLIRVGDVAPHAAIPVERHL